ncbi:hypothetical protein P4S72_07090 [Vibrio sp. PP-XX7]
MQKKSLKKLNISSIVKIDIGFILKKGLNYAKEFDSMTFEKRLWGYLKAMILQVNKMYSPDIGGVETVVKDISEYLKEYDDITVLCCHKKFSLRTTKELINGVRVYRCASFGTFMSMPVSIVFFLYLFFKQKSKFCTLS